MSVRRAFSLVEVLIAGALLVLLVALTGANLRAGRTRAESHALALEISQELRAARDRALSRGIPVAVVFPSGGGANPTSQGYFLLEGESEGKLIRQINLSGNYQQAAVFVGVWPVSGATNRKQPASPLAGQAMLDLQTWLPGPYSRDYCFAFGPDGRLRTNDLTEFDGAVHLLVVNGAEYSGSSAPPGPATVTPGPNFFAPGRVGSPWTIAVSTSGSISLAQGVRNGSVPEVSSLAFPTPPANVPAAAASSPQEPVITGLRVRPQVNTNTLPPSCDATVPLDGHLSFFIEATDPDADQLFCEWSANGGAFSSASQDRMVWDVAEERWKCEWEWRPPGNAGPGDRFQLTYRVFDSDGQVAAPFGAAVMNVETTPTQRIVFSRDMGGGNADIWIVNSDGTGIRNLTDTPAVNEHVAAVSADGTKISFFHGSSGNMFVMNSDGTDPVQLAGGGNYCPVVSPRGNLVAFAWRASGSDYQVWGMLPDGSNRHFIADMTWGGGLSSDQSGVTSFSPDGSKLAYPKHDATWDIYTVNIDSSSPALLVSTPGNDQKPIWSEDGWVWFVSDQDGNNEIYKVREDGSSLTRVTNDPGEDDFVSTSPDRTQIAVARNGDIFTMDPDGSNARQVTIGAETDFRPVWMR